MKFFIALAVYYRQSECRALESNRSIPAALQETFWIALDTLRSHKLRTFLTLLGVFLGILAYPGKLDAAVDQTREVLRRRRSVPYDRPDDFSIQTNAEAVQSS